MRTFSAHSRRDGVRSLLVTALASVSALAFAAPACAQADQSARAAPAERDYSIPAQPLSSALTQFAEQSELQIIFSQADVAGLTSPPLVGRYTRHEALERLLAQSDLEGRIDGHTIRLSNRANPQSASAGALAEPTVAPAHPLLNATQSDLSAENATEPFIPDEEVFVTGTRLPGQRSPSPVTVIDRDAIEESGTANVTQLMRLVPQNFGGGPNETTRAGEGANNLLEGSSINLRGLGADSTLVLINGRRISTTGTSNGLFVDVSAIPVAAIERVEVLTDGASAIYGSDAIGGVVNFILRDDFDGADMSVRHGAAYDGAAAESGLSLAFGRVGDRTRLFAVYDVFSRDPLANAERGFAANSDLTSLGGSNFSLAASNPATVVSPVIAAVPPGQDGTALDPSDFLIGERNLQNTNEGQHILGEQKRQSLYLSGAFDLSSSAELFGELRGSVRDFRRNRAGATSSSLRVPAAHPGFVELTPGSTMMTLQYSFIDDLGPVVASGTNESIGLVGGVRFDLGETWRAELAGSVGREDGLFRTDNAVNSARLNEALGLTDAVADFDPTVDGWFNPFADGSNTPRNVLDFIRGWSETRYASAMDTVSMGADGELFALPAEAVRLAVGAEYREESFDTRSVEFTSALTPVLRDAPREERDVVAYFAEARVPFVSPEQGVFGVRALELTLAARHEDTSNGGADTTPKIGLIWSPVEGVLVRSSWGRSFKSPSLTETVAGSQAALVFAIADPASPTGFTTTLVLQGTNPGLESETAESWTAGFALRPPALEGFTFDLNAFRIDFENRIAAPANPFTVLTDPVLYAPIITRDPDDAEVQAHFDAPYFIPIGPTPPASDVGAIVDARLRNLSRSSVSGIDISVSQAFAFGGFDFTASLSGSYLFSFEQAFSETGPTVDLVDTANNPIDLRLRGALSWRRDSFSGQLAVNYADDYRDTAGDRTIGAFTTVDLTLGYDFGAGVEARLFARNLFNEDPPFFNNPIGVGYDPENADPVGRFVGLQLTKAW